MSAIDLTGRRSGRLTIIRPTDGRSRSRSIIWECRCDCGNTVFVPAHRLTDESTKSCGCLYRKNLAGQRFGMLTAIQPTTERRDAQIVWECKCDCGNTAYVRSHCLISGKTKSCGCNRYKSMVETKERNNGSR